MARIIIIKPVKKKKPLEPFIISMRTKTPNLNAWSDEKNFSAETAEDAIDQAKYWVEQNTPWDPDDIRFDVEPPF